MTGEDAARDYYVNLAQSNQSTESDAVTMQGVLRKIGFPNAVVTSGIVYLEGHGTLEFPPTDIHSIARMLCKKMGLLS